MKKVLSIAICMAMSISVFAQSAAFADELVFSGEKTTYVVLTKTEKDGKEIISNYDGEALGSNKAINCELTERQAERLEDQPQVLAVSEDIILEGTGKKSKRKKQMTNDALEQWNLDAIGVSETNVESSDVKIEVLDSGVSYTDDINIQNNVNLVPGEEEVSVMFEDANGHGTGIAGLIGAKDNNDGIKGVFPNAEIYSVKALDEDLKSPLSRIVEGIYWGIENDMDIINMSFGTIVDSDVLHEAVKAAANAGIILIAAAGNTEHQNINYPAAYNEVIAVGSINAEGELAELTSTGTELELLAPGEQVYTTGLFYGTIGISGTSIATAQVTGTAALLKAKDKTKSADFIRGLLKASSKEVAGTGAGLIDYDYALKIYNEYANSYVEGEDISDKFENTEKIPDYSDDADVVVEGLWAATKHGEMCENNSYVTNQTYITIMSTAAKNADTANYVASTGNGFHGGANYVATMRAIWYMSVFLKRGNTPSEAKANALQKFKNHGMNNDAYTRMTTSLDQIIKYIGKETDPQKRRFMALGFAAHCCGDVFAHRVIIPYYTVAGTNPVAIKQNTEYNDKLGSGDFVLGSQTTDANLKSFAKNNSVPAAHKTWQNCQQSVVLGVLEFRDLKQYLKTSTVYDDNPSFCKERYAEAVESTYSLIAYAMSFDKFNLGYLLPQRDHIKLNNFKNYTAAAKESTDIEGVNWSKISTSAFV